MEAFTILGFHMFLQMALGFSCTSLFFHAHFIPLSEFESPIPIRPPLLIHVQQCIYLLGRSISPCLTLTVYLFPVII